MNKSNKEQKEVREIKFRVWDKENKKMIYQDKHTCFHIADEFVGIDCEEESKYYKEFSWSGSLNCMLMQYTGLTDKNGKEIYEFMELNNKYEVIYKAPCYVLRDISNGDIISISNYNSKDYVITREYTKI